MLVGVTFVLCDTQIYIIPNIETCDLHSAVQCFALDLEDYTMSDHHCWILIPCGINIDLMI